MKCRGILSTGLYTLVLFLCVMVPSVKGDDFTVTPLSNISDIAVYEVTGDYNAEMPDGSDNIISRQEITKEFYTTHPDDYDLFVIFSNFDFQMPQDEAVAFYQGVKNDVQGIGIELVDNTSLYGSNGVLQGTIDMGNINSIISDPLDSGFSNTMGTLSHELLHRWAAKVTFQKADNSISNDLLGSGGYHWSFLLDTAGSLEYGNRWVNNGNGTFTSLAGRRYFSSLDMYLMGFIDKSEVPSMLLIDNPKIDSNRLTEPGITIDGTPQYVSIDDIIAAEGERIPSVADSQKTFKIGCIFITRPDTYSETDLYRIRNIMKSWPMWVSGLTNGLGKVAVDSAPLDNLPENPGPDIPPIDPRTAPPEINDGIAWLLNNQEEDGRWQDSLFTAERDTATVLSTLVGYPIAADAYAQGVAWLDNTDTVNLDYLARKTSLLGTSGFDISGLVAELLQMQNPDGGWGSSKNYGSNNADTALALRALTTTGEASASVTDPAISYLLSKQNTEGGWGTEGRSNIQTTIDVITSFIPFKGQYQLDIPIYNSLTWINGKQNTDGGFGNSPSTIYSTAKTLIALKQIGITSQATDRALSYILDRQGQDGSWLSSSYQTALAVNAIWIAMRDPDLSVSTTEIVPSPNTITSLPSDVSLSVTIHNSGMPDISDTKVVLYEGAVNNSSKIGETLVSISGQSSETVVFKTTINKGSPHHYYVVVDPDNLIKESSEQNNSALRILYPESTYDFALNPEDISVVPAAENIFEPLAISAKIKNNGTVDAFSVPLHLVADNGTGPIIVATRTINLPAGQSVDYSMSWVPEISGVGLSLSIVVDPHNAFAETAEDNNTATVAIDITASTKPDLSLSYSDISFDPAPALEAGIASLNAKISNRGFSPATNVQVDFYDGVPGESGNAFLGSVTIAVIGPGENVDVILDWANIPVSGKRVISVVVDPQNAIDEIREGNNSTFTTLQVLTLPDFAVSDTAISFSPEAPHEGDQVTVSAVVLNRGEQPGANIPVAFYERSALLGTSIIPQITANGQATASIVFDTTGKVGIIPIKVIVDPDSTILEQDRGNNSAARSVGIQNSDLWLSDNFISPNGDGVKDSTDFGYRLTVPQDVTVVVVNQEGEIVRKYAGPEFAGTTFVSLTWDGLDNRGRVVGDGQYRIQVLSETGTVLASLLVTVDTNRSSLLKAFGTPYLFTTTIEYLLSDYKYNWLPDDSGVVFYLATKKPERPEYETGIYTISPTGGEITRLTPEEWSEDADPEIGYRYVLNSSDCNNKTWMFFECDQVNPGFALSADGYTVAFILEKYNKTTLEVQQQQLWTVDRFGEKLTLLETFDYLQGDTTLITDIFPSPDGTHIAYKLYDQNTSNHYFAIIGPDGTEKTVYAPEWGSGFDSQHRLIWAPDGQKLVFSDTAHAVVADLAGNMLNVLEIQYPAVFFDWYGSSRILVREINDVPSSWLILIDSWAVDLNKPDNPQLIAANLEIPDSGWYEFDGCIKNGAYSYSKTPLLENGFFIAGFERSGGYDEYFVNYIVCDIDGNCQDSDLIEIWWPNMSLTPDAGKIVMNDTDGVVETFDRKDLKTEIFEFGWLGCDNYLDERYNFPSHYKIWPPTESDCADYSYLDVTKWNWLDNDTFLAYYYGRSQDNIIAFNIENGERTLVLEDISFLKDTLPYRLALSPNKRYLSFLNGPLVNHTRIYNHFRIVGSLLNLTADLRPSKTESAVNLQGIAADLNFASWQLEYADQKTPNDWRIITPPVNNPVVNGLLAIWIPPHEGSFLVRLTVTDKAGNTAWDRRIVTWGKKFSVTDIYKTGELFSPNDDGVKDTVGLNYSVHEPVHLELSVHDQDGMLVKTFMQDHALPGEYGIVWDGRDAYSAIVPDGYYSIRIFDYEFFYQVDTTPPKAQLEFSEIICPQQTGAGKFIPEMSANLYGLARDVNLKSWTVYYGYGEIPQEWYPVEHGESLLAKTDEKSGEIVVDDSGNPIPVIIRDYKPGTSPPIGFLGNTTYRIIVEDFAGNRSVVTTQLNEEIPFLGWWDGAIIGEIRERLEKNSQGLCEHLGIQPIHYLEHGTHNLTIVETIRKPIVSATVQYRMHTQWNDSREVIDPPDGEIDLTFDTSSLNLTEIAAARVKIVDITGLEYYSNAIEFNAIFTAGVDCFPTDRSSPALITVKVSLPEDLEILKLQVTNTVSGAAEWDDFAEYNNVPGRYDLHYEAPFPEDLPEGYEYPLRFVAISESGRVYISNEVTAPTECRAPKAKECKPWLEVSYDGVLKAPCNSINPVTAKITVRYSCLDPEPKDLPDKIKYFLEENGEWRLLKEFDRVLEGWGSITLDTASLQEGAYPVRIDFVNDDPVVFEPALESKLIVDRTLPEARITYPLSGPLSTPHYATNTEGEPFSLADIEGVADDANGIRGYSIKYGQGRSPVNWLTTGIVNLSSCDPDYSKCELFDTVSKDWFSYIEKPLWCPRNDIFECPVYEGCTSCLPPCPGAIDCNAGREIYIGNAPTSGQMGTWNVFNLAPMEYTLQLEVTDKFGNTSCASIHPLVEEYMTLTASVDRSLFSPNSDGIMDKVSVDYQVSGYTVVDITVFQDDTIVRTLISDQEMTYSSGTIIWDGLDETGTTVPDGKFQIRVEASVPNGQLIQKNLYVTVDNTPPMTVISFPGTEDPLAVVIEVIGTAKDEYLQSYQLHAKDETGLHATKLLKRRNVVVEDDILGIWNTFDLEDNWALILSAEDSAGNTKTTQVVVNFGIRSQLISGLQADPILFSPNGDGRFDSTTVTYELTDTANITIAIEDVQGNGVANQSLSNVVPGIHQYLWLGLDAGGSAVPDGKYSCKVTAESITAPFIAQEEDITLIADTTPPTINVTAPIDSSYHIATVDVKGTVMDLNLREYNVYVSGGQDTVLFDTAATGSEIVITRSLDLPDGVYEVEVNAMDSVENASSQTVSFTVDKTQPRITLESPAEGEFFGGSQSVVLIKGLIEETNLQSYSVQYSSVSTPTQWVDLASGEELPPDNLLATWAVGPNQAITDGDYTVRVTAVDKAGWDSEALVGIHVDNNDPELAVTHPEDGSFVKDTFDIIGTVNDLFLKEYTLELVDTDCSIAANWSTLRTGTQSIQNDTISSVQALPSDGVYCIRLSAVDFLDHTSELQLSFTVDTTPPAPPVLSGTLEGGTGVSLEWQGNTEPDLAGFNLFRNNEKINTVLLSEQAFLDQDLYEGEYTYTVRAVDLAGWESVDSNQVVFTVDFSPPEAMINSPRDGFLVSNYVDITGRAYSADDFKEYRVSYGIGENPQTWQLLRKSPVPVSYGVLVRWDVITLEDGPYTIKLEAEDLKGNINEKIVAVTVDNTPLAAPVLLTATPDGAIVDLTWQANSEPDLAGYLVFRNGQLANVSGTVLGDLTPYLFTDLSFKNIDVPDGTHDYYLVAMDDAGNMSDQSNSLQVSIDTHAPHLDIIYPSAGKEFDKPIPVKAESEDTDIDTVQFQYQRSGDVVWTDLGSTLSKRPYVVNLDPSALGWEYGTFRLRSVATDLGGLVDAMPEEVEVHFKDVTPPAPPTGITPHVNGGLISLSWNQNQEVDFAGYNVFLGTGNVKRNTALLREATFIDPSQFGDGEYAFTITAVDASGNESEKTPVTAIVFIPVLNQPTTPVSVPELTVSGNTVPGATIEIFRNLTSETESLGTTQAGTNGLFSLVISLTEGSNNFFAIANDPDGNISLPSNTILMVFGAPPAAPMGLAAEVNNYDVSLSWNGITEPDLAGYNIYRTTTAEWQKINPTVIAASSYADLGLKNGIYAYRVTAVDNTGNESGPSNEISAVIDQQLPAPPSNLTATAVPEGKAIDLCWNNSIDPVDGHLIYRSFVSGEPYTQVSSGLAQGPCYNDSDLTNGTEYFYVVRAIDTFGNESINSNEDSAIPQDTITPEKPLILLPTISGRPYQSPTEQVDVAGMSEAGAMIDLIHDQEWIDTVDALTIPIHETFLLTDSDIYETVATPDGKSVFYSQRVSTSFPNSYEYYTFWKHLETNLETRIDQIPEGSWDHKMSPDGTRIAYNFDDNAGWVKIGIYDIGTGTATPLITGVDVDVDDWEPAWSSDSAKIVFDSDRGNGFYDMWMHDLTSGETTRVTQDFDGYYPEISPDGQKISFLSWDSVTRKQDLYLVDSISGAPILIAGDVDGSAYYPSVEWSPQGNKLAYTANLDGTYDLFVLDTDTDVTNRLTNSESAEINLQWSPDGKFISYHSYINGATEVRMIAADAQAEGQLLLQTDGSIYQDFNWLPSGIFYRVDSDLHRIIPPGTFIFKDVNLHAGQNVFTTTAEDAAGHVSEPADEILVQIDADAMPDLEVLDQDIFILPRAPLAGEGATLGAVVRNRSAVAAENVYAEIYVWDTNDNIELIHSETIPSLGPYSEEWLSVNWDTTDLVGTNSVFVLLDPDNEIAESLEDNNFASSNFYVAAEEGVFFETTLNGNEFWSDEVVSIHVNINNSGSEKDVQVSVIIEDKNGVLVDELADLDKTLFYGSSDTIKLNWHASSVFAGTYQVKTILVDSAEGPVGEEIDPFTVLPDIELDAVLTTDKVEYGPDEDVLLNISVANQGTNSIIPKLEIKLTISDTSLVHHTEEHTLVNLYPMDSTDISTLWNTARNVPGTYTASLEMYMDSVLVAARSTEFVIVPNIEISGNISVDPKVIFRDGGVDVGYSVASSGNVDAGTILLKLHILDTRNMSTVSTHEESITLGRNETITGQHKFAGPDWDIAVYRVLLQSIRQGETKSLASDSFTVRDGVAPVVSILSPVDGSVLSDSFNLSVVAIDDTTDVAKVEHQIDNGSWLPLPLVNPVQGRYSASWLPDEADEGPHTLRFRATDIAGNQSQPVASAIVIRPKVDITTAIDKASFGMNENVAVSINLINIAWQKNVHLAMEIEGQNGAVIAQVTDENLVLAADKQQTLNYTWHTGIVDAGNYTIRSTVTQNGSILAENQVPFAIAQVLVVNGTLTLSDTSVPLGDSVRADWSVSNNGNFNVTGLTVENALTGQDSALLQTWTETIALQKGQAISGSFLILTQNINLGSYQVTLKARHESEDFDLAVAQFELIDITPPVVTILSPVDGTIVEGPVEVTASATDDVTGVAMAEYQVDDGSWLPLMLVDQATGIYTASWLPVEADEGPHTIRFRAADNAGNQSQPVESTIVIRPRVDMTTAIDKASYSMNEDVVVSVDLINIAWQKQVHLAVQVETHDGIVVALVVEEDLLLAGDTRQSLSYSWHTGAMEAGNYNVRSTATKNGAVLSENLVPFVIEQFLIVNGTLTLSDTSVPLGNPVTVNWSVANNSNFNITELTVEHILTDQASAQLQTWTETITLQKEQTVSGSFQIQTQGMSTGSYQVTLKARYESEDFDLATAQFELIDVMPPVVIILSPADGTLVNGPIELAASAMDDGSGVDILEYRIDQREWQPLLLIAPAGNSYSTLWTPSETDEGNRIISFRGRDKSGNISEPVSVGVIVELCKAFEDLAGSLNISPVPLYYSQDVELEYSIINQCNKSLSDLNIRVVIQDPATNDIVYEAVTTSFIAPGVTSGGSFILSSLELNTQQYNVLLEIYQTNKEPRILAESSFEILSPLGIENKPLDQSNLLVWLNNGYESCNKGNDDDDNGRHHRDDNCDDRHDGKDDCDNNDNNENNERDDDESQYLHESCEQRCSSYARLGNILNQATDYFMIVCNRDDFELELRNPIYTDIIIIGDKHQLTDHHDEELREKVHSGTGLISFSWHVPGDHLHDDDDNGHDDSNESFLGVTVKGMLFKTAPAITLVNSPISNAGELNIGGKLVYVEPAKNTEVVGWIIGECSDDDDDDRRSNSNNARTTNHKKKETEQYPVIVLNEYGQGHTVYAAFNLCEAFNDLNDGQLTDLLINAVSFVHKPDDSSDLAPYQIKPFAIEVTSPDKDIDLMMSATCPAEIVLFDPALDKWVEEYPWEVPFPVMANETTLLPYYVLAPDQEGLFTCELNAGIADGNQYTFLQKFIYEFAVNKDKIRRLNEAKEAINNLDVKRRERAKQTNALQFLQKISDRTVLGKEQTEMNIHDIKKAINSLLQIQSVDISDIRLQLDIILRIEMGRYYLYE